MINYSIIIPHYNRPNLLNRALSSIPRREDVEVIVVDDHSAPSLRPVVTVPYHLILSDGQHGKGPGYARNIGIEHAQGKWVIFVDSDDYCLPALCDMMDRYVDDDADVIYFKSAKEEADGTLVPSYEYLDEAVDRAIAGDTDQLFYYTPAPWAKFIKRDYLLRNQIRFQQVIGGDDILFSINLAKNTKKYKFVDVAIYCVVMAPNSLTRYTSWQSPYNFTIASCSAYTSLSELHKEKMALLWIRKWWQLLWRTNKLKALSLLPILLRILGMRLTLSTIKKAIS